MKTKIVQNPERLISKSRMNKLEASVKSAKLAQTNLEQKISLLNKQITSKERIIHGKEGEADRIEKLTSAEVRGLKLSKSKSMLDKRQAKVEFKKVSEEYSEACKHNAEIIKQQSKKFSQKLESQYQAKKQKDERQEKVNNLISNLLNKGDQRIISLTEALTNPKSFRKEMDGLLNDADNETYVTISGLSAVKTEIYNEVRSLLSESSIDNADESEDKDVSENPDNPDNSDESALLVVA